MKYILTFLLLTSVARAATYTATDCGYLAVQAAVNACSAGDTAVVPAGSADWTNTIVITVDIQLTGAGAGQTVIVDEVSRSSSPCLIYCDTAANGFPRISGFTFEGGVTNVGNDYRGSIILGGDCNSMRIDHCQFTNLFNSNVVITGPVYGVIDHCQFQIQNWDNGVKVFNSSSGNNYGDMSWASPAGYGTTNWMVIENCSFTFPTYPYQYVDDMVAGGRLVFRYNCVTNMGFQTHGTETSGRLRGGRAYEIYMNTFVMNVPGWVGNGATMQLRSGTGVIFSNSITGYQGALQMMNDRSSEYFGPWGGANGQNPWDTNNPSLLASGTHTGANGATVLTDSGASWTVNQWVGGYELQDITQGGGGGTTGAFGLIVANDAHTITTAGSHLGQLINWTNGDSYAIYQSYHQLDQIGLGSGDLVTGDDLPTNSVTGLAWPREVSEPMYYWGNSFNGTEQATDQGAAQNLIQFNRDFFNGPRPGYTPMQYPNPLVTVPVASGAVPLPWSLVPSSSTCVPVAGNLDQWPMKDGSGSTAADVGSGANSISLTGSPTWNPAGSPNGGGLTFNGSSQSGSTVGTVDLSGGGTGSFTVWFKTSDGTDLQVISETSASYSLNDGSFVITLNESVAGSIQASLKQGGINVQRTTATTGFADGNWHFLAVTFDTGLGTSPIKIYVDGNNEALTTIRGDLTMYNLSAWTLYLGARNNNSYWFNGSMTDPRIYTTALSGSDITKLYNGNASVCP